MNKDKPTLDKQAPDDTTQNHILAESFKMDSLDIDKVNSQAKKNL